MKPVAFLALSRKQEFQRNRISEDWTETSARRFGINPARHIRLFRSTRCTLRAPWRIDVDVEIED